MAIMVIIRMVQIQLPLLKQVIIHSHNIILMAVINIILDIVQVIVLDILPVEALEDHQVVAEVVVAAIVQVMKLVVG